MDDKPVKQVEVEVKVGYSYSKSGLCWFRIYMVKAWINNNGKYVEVDPNAVVEVVEKNWHVSRTKRYACMKIRVQEGTVIKFLEGSSTLKPVYYIATEEGLKELKAETVKVDVISTPTFKAWYYKNIVKLPDGSSIEDVAENPKIYSSRRLPREYRLSEVEELKREVESWPRQD